MEDAKGGFRVMVFGPCPRNSLLTFGAEAGTVLNKAVLQASCDVIQSG